MEPDRYVIEHRRVLGGDWVKVQTVGEDLLDETCAQVDAYNALSGVGDWRVRPVGEDPSPDEDDEAGPFVVGVVVGVFEGELRPSLWQRFRWWWLMRTSKRGVR